jgi:hypothetical protein|tara:strand:+ start:118 stop:555 length:438 start_codon:yes stop_codon:yes gene_type:complete
MAITPINNLKNIIDKLKSKFKTEFGSSLRVYLGHENEAKGSQYLQLNPVSNTLLEYASFAETREYNIDMIFYSARKNIDTKSLENVYRMVARIEALIHDNITMTLADSTQAYDCKIESTTYNTQDDEEKYVVTMNFNCKHTGNVA